MELSMNQEEMLAHYNTIHSEKTKSIQTKALTAYREVFNTMYLQNISLEEFIRNHPTNVLSLSSVTDSEVLLVKHINDTTNMDIYSKDLIVPDIGGRTVIYTTNKKHKIIKKGFLYRQDNTDLNISMFVFIPNTNTKTKHVVIGNILSDTHIYIFYNAKLKLGEEIPNISYSNYDRNHLLNMMNNPISDIQKIILDSMGYKNVEDNTNTIGNMFTTIYTSIFNSIDPIYYSKAFNALELLFLSDDVLKTQYVKKLNDI
jgi:hypothetical protein